MNEGEFKMKAIVLMCVSLGASCAKDGGKASPPPQAPAAVTEEPYVRYLHYAKGTAPYLARARQIAADPANGGDARKVAIAYESDALMKTYASESARLMKLYKLTAEDISKYAPLLADSESLVSAQPNPAGRSTFMTSHSEPSTRMVEDHADETRAVRSLLSMPAPQLPIDCGRQPESCSCTDCGHSCETPAADAEYRQCTEGCIADAAKCAIETLGVASFVCAIPFSICMDKCNRRLGASCD